MSGSLRWRIGIITEEGADCRGCGHATRGRRRRRRTGPAQRRRRLPALWMLLNWRLQLRPVRDLWASQGSASGQDSPLPFLRRRGFSSAHNGDAMQEKSPGGTRAGAGRDMSVSDKDHSVGAGAKALVMTPPATSPLSKRSGGRSGSAAESACASPPRPIG